MRWNDHPPTNQHQLPSTQSEQSSYERSVRRRIEYIKMCFCELRIFNFKKQVWAYFKSEKVEKERMKKHMLIPTLHPTY